MKKIIFILLVVAVALSAARKEHEVYYQHKWCKCLNGQEEVVLSDKTRVDCLTSEYAVEVDFADKWGECLGQSMYYGLLTERKPACLLIMENETDERYLKRLKKVADEYKIKVFIMKNTE